jgi:hypothetical protein
MRVRLFLGMMPGGGCRLIRQRRGIDIDCLRDGLRLGAAVGNGLGDNNGMAGKLARQAGGQGKSGVRLKDH